MAPDARRRAVLLAFLFSVTVLNFIDRQTLSILAPQIREIYQFSAAQYGQIVSAFQFGMMVGELPMGWLMDRAGPRIGFTFAVLWWSAATSLHAVASNLWQFGILRFWMGTGEAGNFPGALKVISQRFEPKDRAFAVGVVNGGTMIGAVIAPPLIVFLAQRFGFQAAFLFPAALGLLWVIAWVVQMRPAALAPTGQPLEAPVPTLPLLADHKVWALMACRFFVGPVMQFYWYWMPDYLYHERGLSLGAIGALSWIPYLIGDVGSIGGGWFSGWLIRRGHTVRTARWTAMLTGAALCLCSLLVFRMPTVAGAIAVISIVLFGHTFLSANMFSACSDLMPMSLVGRTVGLTGVAGGLSGLLFPLLTGGLIDRFSYMPLFVMVGFMPLIGVLILFGRTRKQDWEGSFKT